MLACVLHFVDAETAHGVVSTFVQALAPGSYVVISVGFGQGRTGTDFASTYNAHSGPRIYAHSWPEITGLFSGLELVPPGIVETTAWLPGQPDTVPEQRSNMIVAGVGRRLLPPGSLARPVDSGQARSSRGRTGGEPVGTEATMRYRSPADAQVPVSQAKPQGGSSIRPPLMSRWPALECTWTGS